MFGLADRLARSRSLVQTPQKGEKISAFQIHQSTQNYSSKYNISIFEEFLGLSK